MPADEAYRVRSPSAVPRVARLALMLAAVCACLATAHGQQSPQQPSKPSPQSNCANAAECKASCDKGENAACNELGRMHWYGTGGATRDERRAAEIARQLCDRGDLRGCLNVAFAHEFGRGAELNLPKAMELYQKVCDAGDQGGCAGVANMLFYGEGVQKDPARAIPLLTQACNASIPSACNTLGYALETAQGIAQDLVRAADLYEKACNARYAPACGNLGLLYRYEKGKPRDNARAASLFKQACDGEDALGCVELGRMYYAGLSLERNPARAANLFRQACEAGNSEGCGRLASLYLRGEGVERNPKLAAQLNQRACDRDEPPSCYSLARQYWEGNGVEKDPVKAVVLYRRTCDQGFSMGCASLGIAYTSGTGVERNENAAKEMFEKACATGDPSGCEALGYQYQIGGPVEKDLARAKELYEKSCRTDSRHGCTMLGKLFFDGIGIPKDESRAVELFRGACDLDDFEGCFMIGIAAEFGRGLPLDERLAAAAYARGCEMNDDPSCKRLEKLKSDNPSLAGVKPIEPGWGQRSGGTTGAASGARTNSNGPEITILEPSEEDLKAAPAMGIKSLRIRGRARDSRGVFNVTVDQKPAGIRGLDQDSVEFWMDEVLLRPGRNEIVITAVNRERGESRMTLVVERPEVEAGAGGSTKLRQGWAVVVGISKYGPTAATRYGNLDYARADAEAFYKMLRSQAGGQFFPAERTRLLLDEQATSQRLREALMDFLRRADRNDLVMIYFAGHGVADTARPDLLYLLTSDADPERLGSTAFAMEEFKRALTVNILAQNVVAFVDACHSGGVGATLRSGQNRFQMFNQYVNELAISRPGVVAFSASDTTETSIEDKRWGGGHGVFTHYLLEGMRGGADRDKDGYVRLIELLDFVSDMVRRDTDNKQHPTPSKSAVWDPTLPLAILEKRAPQ